jgi:hypothetical protein
VTTEGADPSPKGADRPPGAAEPSPEGADRPPPAANPSPEGAVRPRAVAAYRPPGWVFPLGLLTALEPVAVIVLYFANSDLADGHLVAYAVVGGLFITMPSLAILGLALIWHRRMVTAGQDIRGVPPALTGRTASRVSAISLVVSTLLFGLLLAVLLGPWSLLAAPPLALSLGSAWLMNEAGAARVRT